MRPIVLGYFFSPANTMEIGTFHFRTSGVKGVIGPILDDRLFYKKNLDKKKDKRGLVIIDITIIWPICVFRIVTFSELADVNS